MSGSSADNRIFLVPSSGVSVSRVRDVVAAIHNAAETLTERRLGQRISIGLRGRPRSDGLPQLLTADEAESLLDFTGDRHVRFRKRSRRCAAKTSSTLPEWW